MKSARDLLSPSRMEPCRFKETIIKKGWRLADVAYRWGISAEHLSRIMKDTNRDSKWDELAKCLPRLARIERANTSKLRRELTNSPVRSKTKKDGDTRLGLTQLGAIEEIEKIYGPVKIEEDGLRYEEYIIKGCELVAIEEIDGFAEEGEFVVVVDVHLKDDAKLGIEQEFIIENSMGKKISMGPGMLEKYFCETGRTIY